eukprot:CAMPEP_0118939436 /NCGR_PEP_ID=MMETSP1169-20130426/28904_1 /TAXON_ID=36882 /ORGANISM="Pyramimonas obovata, Strain CCMP722" /LENGTH=73 /DNA_ID=CAMNT_0006883705 /DNA_START=53 /DNA_END=271 /DNA_ORIENTATION=-
MRATAVTNASPRWASRTPSFRFREEVKIRDDQSFVDGLSSFDSTRITRDVNDPTSICPKCAAKMRSAPAAALQ